MGILDDAIREHLELKRKHGVAEEELQRQEEEALGPARRDMAHQHEEAEPTPGHTATAEDGDAVAPASLEDTALFDMEHAEVGADESPAADEPPAAVEATSVEPPPVEPPPVHSAPVEPEESPGDIAEDEPEPDEDDLLTAEPEDEGLDDQGLEDEESEEGEEEDADVLEDTPDFLQETPEHDRLWFEQKPPRDFDFD
jgi:hypothetical protein